MKFAWSCAALCAIILGIYIKLAVDLERQILAGGGELHLENLMLNLIRIQSLIDNDDAQVAYHLVRESQFLIEWLVPTLDLEVDLTVATTLVDLQRQLSCWKLNWSALWSDPTARQTIASEAQVWLDRLQEQSLRLVS